MLGQRGPDQVQQACAGPSGGNRQGEWKCRACGHWLKNSLQIAVHVGKAPAAWAEHIRKGGALCTSPEIVFECRDHGQEAA